MANNDEWVTGLLGRSALGSVGASSLLGIGLPVQPVKRKVYFAFRFADIMRVNNVRQSGKVGQDEEKNPRDFYDRSIWEQRSINDPDGLKRLMREAVEHSSVVCVLVGSDTWNSRWVKYEIARAVVDNKGLLAVGINNLPHIKSGLADSQGINPLQVMGVYKSNGRFYLAEYRWELVSQYPQQQYGWRWHRYDDYADPVSLPRYMTEKAEPNVCALSEGAGYYDYVASGGTLQLGTWLDTAARQANR